MAASDIRFRIAVVPARHFGLLALSLLLALGGAATKAVAQDFGALGGNSVAASAEPGAQLRLEADRLTYDNDRDVVTAAGSVRIEYNGVRLVADRVTYDRKRGRLMASGGVQIIDAQGMRVFSNEIDVTEDFGEGFVNALRVETIDKTYVAAESATREGGQITTFNNGVYTACAPCEEKPDSAPIWRVKARRVIMNGQTRTIRFESARFELFGLPIAYLPVAEIPDPSVKRKSGFLFPNITFSNELGVGVTVPYYFALSPTYDLTATGTYYSKQGFLAEAEFRQRFNSGQYTLKVAGISQQEPEAFDINTVDRGTDEDPRFERGMVGSTGRFEINPRWTFGWDVLVQSDKNFANRYDIAGYNQSVRENNVYLTGLNDRNYFDLRGIDFDVQEETSDETQSRDKEQPFVLPSLDYSATPDEPVFGGELSFNVNARALSRDQIDAFTPNSPDPDVYLGTDPFIRGLEGDSGRLTGEVEWKRSMITDAGLVVTPLLAFQADGDYSDITDTASARLDQFANALSTSPEYTGTPVEGEVGSAFARAMATLGLELRWPVLFSASSATHILEPMAQVFARPDEPYLGDLGIPNEDAQSFVFDASTLFERDKFSGYDRIEGGTRANVGLRYSGAYDNGWATNAILGQSFQLAGENSFDAPDLVSVGAYSGLESDRSDYVALAGITIPTGIAFSASGRFDEQTFEMRRGEVKAAYTVSPLSVTGRYAFIQAQPLYGFADDRQEVTSAASLKFAENWSVFGSATYDLENAALASDAVGLAYSDECFGFVATYADSRNVLTGENEPSIGLNVTFRTIGTLGTTKKLSQSGSDSNGLF